MLWKTAALLFALALKSTEGTEKKWDYNYVAGQCTPWPHFDWEEGQVDATMTGLPCRIHHRSIFGLSAEAREARKTQQLFELKHGNCGMLTGHYYGDDGYEWISRKSGAVCYTPPKFVRVTARVVVKEQFRFQNEKYLRIGAEGNVIKVDAAGDILVKFHNWAKDYHKAEVDDGFTCWITKSDFDKIAVKEQSLAVTGFSINSKQVTLKSVQTQIFNKKFSTRIIVS